MDTSDMPACEMEEAIENLSKKIERLRTSLRKISENKCSNRLGGGKTCLTIGHKFPCSECLASLALREEK